MNRRILKIRHLAFKISCFMESVHTGKSKSKIVIIFCTLLKVGVWWFGFGEVFFSKSSISRLTHSPLVNLSL